MAQKIDALTSFSTVDDKITEMIFFLNLLETDPVDLPFLSLHFIKIGLYQQLWVFLKLFFIQILNNLPDIP